MPRKRTFTDEEANHIRKLYWKTDVSYDDLARMFRVSPSTIGQIIDYKGAYTCKKKD